MSDRDSGGTSIRPEWLPLVERMHSVIDQGVAKAVRARVRSGGQRHACRRGCAACCRQNDLPAFQIELAGMSRFCVEQLAGPERDALRERLLAHRPGDLCPFLSGEACVVHSVRPTACRLFNVFGTPCAPDEDAYHTRPGDVLDPPRGLLERAYREMLPFHGVTKREDQDHWLARGLVQTLGVSLRGCDWRSLARLMERADVREGPESA